jgi:hypothetical protein
MKNRFFCILKVSEDFGTDPFVRGTDPRIQILIRIRTKMSRIRNTGFYLFQMHHPDDQDQSSGNPLPGKVQN